MRFFGLEVRKALTSVPTTGNGSWLNVFDNTDRPPGAFQKDLHCDPAEISRNWAVFACQTLIAGDMGKMHIRLMERSVDGIEVEKDVASFSPVLRKPNNFQTQQKFIEQWILSKITYGNAYVALSRDARQVVTAMTVLDPSMVTPLVASDGSVFYRLGEDALAQVHESDTIVPASEIIHDRMWCLYHPLVGVSPIYAAGLAAWQGLEIQSGQATFFANRSQPSGIITAPGPIPDELAAKIKSRWAIFRSSDRGGTAVLGNDMKYMPIAQNAVDSQLVEQLKMSAEMICSAFHVPAYKIGVGVTPTYQNAEVLDQIYYDTCLQTLIEGVESSMDEGLDLPRDYCVKFNLDDLLRMDTAAQVQALRDAVGAGVMSPNEARKRLNLAPTTGGDTPYMQQQNYSLAALDKRDSGSDPFNAAPVPAPAPVPDPVPDPAAVKAIFASDLRRALEAA